MFYYFYLVSAMIWSPVKINVNKWRELKASVFTHVGEPLSFQCETLGVLYLFSSALPLWLLYKQNVLPANMHQVGGKRILL